MRGSRPRIVRLVALASLFSACDGDGGGGQPTQDVDSGSTPDVSADSLADLSDDAATPACSVDELHPDLIRAVFQVDFRPREEGECRPGGFELLECQPGEGCAADESVFITGGMSVFAIYCEEPGERVPGAVDPDYEYCATPDDVELANDVFANYVPNVRRLYDDGTNGDDVAGDGIWTVTLDLPRGIRVEYVYTFGEEGDLWTNHEESPGIQRVSCA